ncbi:Panacea domain-containing protein [Azospirillum rugosum]|uniref:Phage-associated protein n=1 Tax=Azospirillum rugosum TaxID=416170 RepID=A0ABS4SKC6_9PROT|nr:type II toxin-antitoxin system antitoxin SocA domain-containing protein [Azospirillum rugosum]MBP2293006.1 putative phage-associated protein [Azospirillum rugosum]MDQ0526555.1 putative phage-associated protein [Azospirillum rugosum]
MSFDGRAVANFILDFCEQRDREVTNLALQKIVYFCHVWSLVELGRPLVKHQFEAWQYGPVLQYLYREFKAFDRQPIQGRATEIDPDTGRRRIVRYAFDRDTEELLKQTVDFYSRLRAGDLVELSHAKGSPWDEVWNHQGSVNPGMKIGDDRIIAYYSKVPSPYSIQ